MSVRYIMSLGIRKWIVIALLLSVFLMANVMVVTNWLIDTGVCDWARFVRREFLTGTTITVIITLLILLVGPRKRRIGFSKSCPVCDKRYTPA